MTGELFLFVYRGCSMLPTFEDEDRLIVERYSSIEEIQVGDVVTFGYIGDIVKNVVHRVISVDIPGNEIITKGDNNPGPDEPLIFEEVFGKVVNATRPARVEKLVIYNQYSRESREFVKELQRKEAEELAGIQEELINKVKELENSKEAKKYKKSQTFMDFAEAAADYVENLKKIKENEFSDEGIISIYEPASPVTKQELAQLKVNVLNSPEYIAYKNKSDSLRIKEAESEVEFWKPTMIKIDNKEVRERFERIGSFPVVVLNVPESVDIETGQPVSERKEYLHKPADVQEIKKFENKIKDAIKVTDIKRLPLEKNSVKSIL